MCQDHPSFLQSSLIKDKRLLKQCLEVLPFYPKVFPPPLACWLSMSYRLHKSNNVNDSTIWEMRHPRQITGVKEVPPVDTQTLKIGSNNPVEDTLAPVGMEEGGKVLVWCCCPRPHEWQPRPNRVFTGVVLLPSSYGGLVVSFLPNIANSTVVHRVTAY